MKLPHPQATMNRHDADIVCDLCYFVCARVCVCVCESLPGHVCMCENVLTTVDLITLVYAVVISVTQPVPRNTPAISTPMLPLSVTHCAHTHTHTHSATYTDLQHRENPRAIHFVLFACLCMQVCVCVSRESLYTNRSA